MHKCVKLAIQKAAIYIRNPDIGILARNRLGKYQVSVFLAVRRLRLKGQLGPK